MWAERCRELAHDLLSGSRPPGPADEHLREALAWLYRAQDAGGDRGVSHSYQLGRGWLPSYPETTGYIIPTLLEIWRRRGDEEARRRALEMADWELGVQLADGAIPGLASGDPVVFDTGQVLFGWLAAFRATSDERYLAAARRAGQWLLSAMDEDGAWRRHAGANTGLTFNARTAWALAELGTVEPDERCTGGARRFLAWSLAQEERPGWFASNCLTDNERPLLHTIAYTAEGQLEAGLLLGDTRCVEASMRTARALAGRVGPRGRMAGRFDREWRPAAGWACLTGMAQIARVWSRLSSLAPDPSQSEAAARVRGFLMATQDRRSRSGGLRGGIRGSFPVNGAYCRYRIPNWAAKFFIDALLAAEDGGETPVYRG